MPHTVVVSPYFRKSLLALAVAAIFTPYYAHALDLAQSPPGTVDPYVAPNVIISIDDSGSMRYRVTPKTDGSYGNGSNLTGVGYTEPDANGKWKPDAQRINVLKYAVKKVFEDKNLIPNHGEGNTFRLAWQAMHNNGGSLGAESVNSTSMNQNSMRLLTKSHRDNFLNFIKNTTPNNGTPTHKMMEQAHNYMANDVSARTDKKNSPWAYAPGDTAEPLLGCRRSYHILMSDGGWQTSPSSSQRTGNSDGGNSFNLPDGTLYDKVAPYADSYSNMVADWAFKSWSTNLQPSLYDKNDKSKQISLTSEYRKAPETEIFGKDGKGKVAELYKYWNPRYNPATWPHLVTYTIGFSKAATTWPAEPNIKKPADADIVPFSYDEGKNGSLPDFITGNLNWPQLTTTTESSKNPLDLWHSALNGRGRFYAVEKPEDLEKAFREIIGVINTQAEPDRSSAAISGMSYQDKPVGMFITSNSPKEAWKGEVRGVKLELTGQTDLWGSKTTAQILDATSPTNRVIVTLNDSSTQPAGIPFRWSNLSTAQQKCFNVKPDSTITANCSANTSVDTKGEQRLNYLRGDRTLELANSNGVFRNRQSRQGDIVNSNVWYTGTPVSNYALTGYAKFTADQKNRLPMIYVGGNDGMLHGFSVEDGTEKIAYVPRAVQANLTRLTWPSFDDNHRYFVDGSPMSGDVDINDRNSTSHTPAWRTMLVSALGAGGKGYFVLDVTNPSNFSENNASALVVMDKTLHSEETINCSTTATDDTACVNTANADIGHIFATPSTDDNNPLVTGQITLLNNNRWAVIMGNGYNSKNGRPVLLIQYLDGNKELLRLPATAANATGANVNDNGLSAPRLVDINNDGRPDVVYAGDLKGNMWKFMIASKSSDTWGVAFNGGPLFTARGGTAGSPATRTLVQPITAPPTVRANDRTTVTGTGSNQKVLSVGGMMVAFGTGRNVTNSDPDNTDSQTLYSVLDNTRYTVAINADDKQSYVSVHPGDSNQSIPAPTPLGTGLNSESKQTLLAQQKVGDAFKGQGKSEGREYWQIDPTSATGSPSVNWNTQRGWYLDLPATGERLLKPMSLYDGSNILAVYTQVPAKGSNINQAVESCEASAVDEERQFLTMLNIMDGKRPSVQLMDMNGDGFYDLSADHGVSRMRVVKGAHRIIGQVQQSTDYGKGDSFNLARMPEQSMRPSWRQLK